MVDDDGGGTIPMDEFLMGCLRLRGQARAVDAPRIAVKVFKFWGRFALRGLAVGKVTWDNLKTRGIPNSWET